MQPAFGSLGVATTLTVMSASTAVRPFSINIDQAELDSLKVRLDSARWPEQEPVDDWSQGTPLAYAKELARYWADQYDWRSREAALNRFDHFITEIEGLDIHFIHQRSPHENAFPLLISHGWPGSVVEFHKVIEPLVDPVAHGGRAADAFHVICPSLPGFGFSGKPTETGWGVEKIAEVWTELMARLGYDRFGAQGGDWGSRITTELGHLGGGCVGIHTNMPVGRPSGEITDPTPAEVDALDALKHYMEWDSGYSKQQSTRPQTLGYGLVDSPVGQMAWIIEKFWAWMDCDGHPENVLTKDELLDNVMLYWLNSAGASSGRLYWESFGRTRQALEVDVPTGVAAFPKEIIKAPRNWCEKVYRNITHWTDMERGGHFAAMEQPEAYVADVRTFFGTVRGA